MFELFDAKTAVIVIFVIVCFIFVCSRVLLMCMVMCDKHLFCTVSFLQFEIAVSVAGYNLSGLSSQSM